MGVYHDGTVCKNRNCNHLIGATFITYAWVKGRCANPDCFYHTHDQTEEMPTPYKDWRIAK